MDKATSVDIEGKGAVTFLDVLGWKGIWKEKGSQSVKRLKHLIQNIKEKADYVTAECAKTDNTARGLETKVLSISDTIALFTIGEPDVTIGIHSIVCSYALQLGIEQELPLRGAISYGGFICSDQIMLGYAVDEAASWHESTDWIGVILTPTAEVSLGQGGCPEKVMSYDHIPFKHKSAPLHLCIKWELPEQVDFYNLIQKKGSQIPDIAGKYMNALKFLGSTRE